MEYHYQMASEFELTYVGHATVLLEMDGLRLLTDPILRDRVGLLRRHQPGVDPACYQDIDVVLLSHLHPDHLDFPSLRMLAPGTPFIVPKGAKSVMHRRGFEHVVELAAGATRQIGNVTIRATPAVHDRARYRFGPEADPVGYVISGRRRVYFAGDTGIFSEMKQEAGDLDVALLPVWGWGFRLGKHHLDPETAAEALSLLTPRLAIPIHWGTLRPIGIGWLNPGYLKHPPRQFADRARELAPDVTVHVIEPGRSLYVDGDGGNGSGPF